MRPYGNPPPSARVATWLTMRQGLLARDAQGVYVPLSTRVFQPSDRDPNKWTPFAPQLDGRKLTNIFPENKAKMGGMQIPNHGGAGMGCGIVPLGAHGAASVDNGSYAGFRVSSISSVPPVMGAPIGATPDSLSSDTQYYFDIARQTASVVSPLVAGKDARETAEVLRARIQNYLSVKDKLPYSLVPGKQWYENQIRILTARLNAVDQQAAESAEAAAATRDWRQLGQTGINVGIAVGGALTLLLIAMTVKTLSR